MHHLPFKMHWEKIRANIHMPRSVQYPSLCFFFFSPALFPLVISSFYFFNKSIAMKERKKDRKGSLQISLSPSLCFSFSLSSSQSFTLGRRRWKGGGLSFFLLLIVFWYGRQCMIHNCASPLLYVWTDRTAPHRTAPGLSAAVPPCRSAALLGTWGISTRYAPVQVSCAAAAAESEAGEA